MTTRSMLLRGISSDTARASWRRTFASLRQPVFRKIAISIDISRIFCSKAVNGSKDFNLRLLGRTNHFMQHLILTNQALILLIARLIARLLVLQHHQQAILLQVKLMQHLQAQQILQISNMLII